MWGRPSAPPVECKVCGKRAEKVSDTALHIGSPGSPLGVVFMQVECHGEKRNVACSFKWLEANRDGSIWLFGDHIGSMSYGLRELQQLDGVALPPEVTGVEWQLQDRPHEKVGPFELAPPNKPVNPIVRSTLESSDGVAEELPHLNRRFLMAMERELRDRPERHQWNAEGARVLRSMAMTLKLDVERLMELLKATQNTYLSTSVSTEMTAQLAVTAMKIFERIGTPATAPKQNIADVIGRVEDHRPAEVANRWNTEPAKIKDAE